MGHLPVLSLKPLRKVHQILKLKRIIVAFCCNVSHLMFVALRYDTHRTDAGIDSKLVTVGFSPTDSTGTVVF